MSTQFTKVLAPKPNDVTVVKVTKRNKSRVTKYARYGESFDDVLGRVMDEVEKRGGLKK